MLITVYSVVLGLTPLSVPEGSGRLCSHFYLTVAISKFPLWLKNALSCLTISVVAPPVDDYFYVLVF